jgi:lipoprotein NlpD
VYAGAGLRGYGNLVIVRHNDQFLSAYAHTSKILVKEGETVKANQKIAEIGSTGTNEAKLHFEIRKDGNPVDPMRLLPKR